MDDSLPRLHSMEVVPRRNMLTLLVRASGATRLTDATYRHVAPRLIAGGILTITAGIYSAHHVGDGGTELTR